ncbi:hypothetical protein GCM10027043_42680 [Ferruginibacter profundus]
MASCQKEYSTENGGGDGAGVLIGADCRISKIAYSDSATGSSIGTIGATIDGSDVVTDITKFDSVTLTIDFNSVPQYFSDTVYVDPDQYYVFDAATKRIKSLHGLIDPTLPGSPEFDVAYNYDAAGFLITKSYTYSALPTIPYQTVTYTYTGGNLTHMTTVDEFTTDIIKDADLTYYTNISPKNYLYLFPDEDTYAPYNQFFNFGRKSTNAVKNLKVRFYDPGNVVVDSAVSAFSSYVMSRDNYVVSAYMLGNDQSSIPAAKGKLNFSYKCK